MKELLRAAKFTLFSISAGIIEIGLFTLLNELLHLPYWLCYFVALAASVLWNFTLNRKYTFRSAANVPVAMLKVAAYYAVFTPLSTLLEHTLTMKLGWNEYLVTAINMILNFVTEFLYQRFFVFGKTIDTNAAAKNGEAKKRRISPLYRFIKASVKFFYVKMTVEGTENIPDEPVIIVGNHTQMNGPIACEIYSPIERYTWCAGQMMKLKEVPGYAFQDFWSKKPASVRWLYKIASYLIAPLAVCVFNNANTIPVYRDSRIITTFRLTVEKLEGGAGVVIFPEHDAPYNNILSDFQDRFVDVARLYYKKTGKELAFVPLYVAPYLKKMVYGRPVRFNASAPIDLERRRICEYLMRSITDIACSLPKHTVVPYRNILKKDYPTNVPEVRYNAQAES